MKSESVMRAIRGCSATCLHVHGCHVLMRRQVLPSTALYMYMFVVNGEHATETRFGNIQFLLGRYCWKHMHVVCHA